MNYHASADECSDLRNGSSFGMSGKGRMGGGSVGYYCSRQKEYLLEDGLVKRKSNRVSTVIRIVLLLASVCLIVLASMGLGIYFGNFIESKNGDGESLVSNEYLWIDSDVGMDDMFAMQVILIHLNSRSRSSQQEKQSLVLSSVSTVFGMTSNATEGKEIIGNMLKTNVLDGISLDRHFTIEKGSNFALKDNLESFRFEHADWYSKVDQEQTNFLRKMKYATKNQLVDISREYEESYQFEPTFTTFNNQVIELESLPDNSLTILSIGPLTNIALWIRNNPSRLETIMRKVKRVISMGGNSVFNSNKEDLEWNYHCDAKSVELVMETFTEKFFMIGLDVANEQAISSDQLTTLKELLLKKSEQVNHRNTASLLLNLLSINPVSCTYDPITASYLIMPELFTFETMRVSVGLSSVVNSTVDFAGRIQNSTTNDGISINVAKSFDRLMYYNFLHSLFSSL